MPLDRVLGPFFDALGDPAVGRRGRWRRAGSLPLLPLIFLAGFVVITTLAYTSPQDPTWIAGLYDAADYDDEIRLLTDTYRHPNIAGEPGRPVAIGPMSAVLARVAACSSPAAAQIAVLFADRLRAPPEVPGAMGHSFSSDSSHLATRESRFLPRSRLFWQQPSDPQAAMLLVVSARAVAERSLLGATRQSETEEEMGPYGQPRSTRFPWGRWQQAWRRMPSVLASPDR